jgi:hypothetical protein
MDDPALQRRVVRAFEHFGFDLPLEAIVDPARRPSRSWLRVATAVAVPLIVVLAIGVLLGRQLATPTSVFGSWQPVPSLADPRLAAAARSVCLHEGDGGATLLIQDQRGLAAELLFRNGNDMIMCLAFFGANGEMETATSSGTHLSPETTTFGLDSVGRAPGFSTSNPGATWLFGHQPPDTGVVSLVLEDGTKVTASSNRGWFVAWWPSGQKVASMSALDAHGNSVTVVAPETSTAPGPGPTEIASSALLPNPGGTCSASQFVLGTPTYAYGFGTLGSTVVFVTVPLRNIGSNCVLDLPAMIGVAAAIGPFHSVPVIKPGPVIAWASETGQSLPMVMGASWWVGVRDESGNAVGSAPPCADPIFDVARVELPFASGSTVIDLPTTWHEVCSSPASVSVTLETK